MGEPAVEAVEPKVQPGPAGGPVVVLIGPPGAGKTTVATALGARTGLPVRDTDADVERVAGRTVAEIFTQSGEATFRALEHDAVATALAEHTGILALGGGAVMDERTRANLGGHRVVFLSISMPVGVKRTGISDQRPMFVGVNPRATFKALLDKRLPVYREVATVEIDTDTLTVDEVVDRIVADLGLAA
jgi:shikimate kinase